MGCEERSCICGLHLSKSALLCFCFWWPTNSWNCLSRFRICQCSQARKLLWFLLKLSLLNSSSKTTGTCAIVGFIRGPSQSVDCVSQGVMTVASHHRNSFRQMLTTYILYAWRNRTRPKSNYHQPCSSVQQTGFSLSTLHHWESSSSAYYHPPATNRIFSLSFWVCGFLKKTLLSFICWYQMSPRREK